MVARSPGGNRFVGFRTQGCPARIVSLTGDVDVVDYLPVADSLYGSAQFV